MYEKMKARVNWPITILLFVGLLTVAFPLYMTIVIAFKQPTEMTNSISGILSLPAQWSLSNFAQAMELTDFWRSLGNSLLVTVSTVVLCIILHSLMGFAVGRNKAHSKLYNLVYLFIVSGMFVPFAILMMPLAKQTAEMHLDNWAGVILLYVVFYMPMNLLLYTGYLEYMAYILEDHLPDHEAHACNGCGHHRTGRMERCYDTADHYVRKRTEHTAAGAADIPDAVRYELQPGVRVLSAGTDPDRCILCDLPETDHQRSGKRRREISEP